MGAPPWEDARIGKVGEAVGYAGEGVLWSLLGGGAGRDLGVLWGCLEHRPCSCSEGESIWVKHGLETRWYSPEREQRNFRDVLPVFLKPGGISQRGSR